MAVGWIGAIHPVAMQITFIHQAVMTEVQLYKSASCQPGSGLIRAFSNVEKPFLLSDLAVYSLTSERARICSRVNVLLTRPPGVHVIATSYLKTPLRQQMIETSTWTAITCNSEEPHWTATRNSMEPQQKYHLITYILDPIKILCTQKGLFSILLSVRLFTSYLYGQSGNT